MEQVEKDKGWWTVVHQVLEICGGYGTQTNITGNPCNILSSPQQTPMVVKKP